MMERHFSSADDPESLTLQPPSPSPSPSPHPKKQRSRCCIVTNYLFLCTLVVVLTIVCKGGTRIWSVSWDHSNSDPDDSTSGSYLSISSERGAINIHELTILLAHYAAVVLAFFIVQGSNPGYLTPDIMTRVCHHDGLSLLGGEDKEEEEEENNNSNYHDYDDIEQEVDEKEGKTLIEEQATIIPSAASSSKEIEMTSLLGKHEITRRSNDNGNNGKHNISVGTTTNNDNNEEAYRKRRKICKTCNFAPPLRSHHCKICNQCVATFDHHCGFIGTCIGERNHCRFYWFLLIQAIGFLKCVSIVNGSNFGFVCFVKTRLYKDVNTVDIWVVIATRGLLYLLTFLAWLMLATHSWFVVTNGTTFEIEKGEYLEYLKGTHMCDIPFSSGLCHNLRLFCCIRGESARWVNLMLSCICRSQRNADDDEWTPIIWKPVGNIDNNSEDWRDNLWSNRYWTCC